MSDYSVTINDHGLGKRLSDPNVRKAVHKAMQKAVNLVVERGSNYPPPRAGSRYRRTGTLGRSISGKVKDVSGNVQGIVGSRVKYAPFVIGKRQAAMHRGRWSTLLETAQDSIDDINGFMEEAAQEVADFIEG